MKKTAIMIMMVYCAAVIGNRVKAQTDEAAQLLLNVEKLAQLKQILTDLEKGYQVLNGGYTTIKQISEGNFSLHKLFLDGLMQISPAVRQYHKITKIINYQVMLVKEHKSALQRFRNANSFSPDELAYIGRVYQNLLNGSLRNLDELTLVVTAGKLRMSDDDRIAAIDRIHDDMSDKLQFLRHFNNNTGMLSLQREKEMSNIKDVQNIYGIE